MLYYFFIACSFKNLGDDFLGGGETTWNFVNIFPTTLKKNYLNSYTSFESFASYEFKIKVFKDVLIPKLREREKCVVKEIF